MKLIAVQVAHVQQFDWIVKAIQSAFEVRKMKDEANTHNPQAFPRPLSKFSSEEISSDQEGMDLRDYFAAKAMQALLTRYSDQVSTGYDETSKPQLRTLAVNSYAIADVMLVARKGLI